MNNEKQSRICNVLGVQGGQEFIADHERYAILNSTLWELSYGEKRSAYGNVIYWLVNHADAWIGKPTTKLQEMGIVSDLVSWEEL